MSDAESIKAVADCRQILAEKRPGSINGRGNVRCMFHNDHDASLYVEKDHAYCHAPACIAHQRLDCFELVKLLDNSTFPEAKAWLTDWYGTGSNGNHAERRQIAPPPQTTPKPRISFATFEDACAKYNPIAVYRYYHADGTLSYAELKIKTEKGKICLPLHEEADGRWYLDLQNVTRTLYKLPELLAADLDEWVLFNEGPKDSDSGWRVGRVSSTTGSSGSVKRAHQDNAFEALRGRRVAVVGDCDDAGKKFEQACREVLGGIVRELRICQLPNSNDIKGYDLSDYVADVGEEHAAKLIMELIDDTPPEPMSAEKMESGGEPAELPLNLAPPDMEPRFVENFEEPRGEDIREEENTDAHNGSSAAPTPRRPFDLISLDPNLVETIDPNDPTPSPTQPMEYPDRPAPDGNHICRIIKTSMKVTKSDNWRLSCKLQRLDDPSAPLLWWNLIISQNGIAYVKRDLLKLNFLHALSELETRHGELVGKIIEVNVEDKAQKGGKVFTHTRLIRLIPENEVKCTAPTEKKNDAPVFRSFYELCQDDIEPPRMIVDQILSEGLALWNGAPKSCKSWMMFQMALAVANGGLFLGEFPCMQGDVLCLSLEDNDRRLAKRLKMQLQGEQAPRNAYYATQWPVFSTNKRAVDGISHLHQFLENHLNTRLVIIDTLAKVRPRRKKEGNMYGQDYEDLEQLQQMALVYGIAIVVVHHTNKGVHQDEFNTISGSTGLSGCADTVAILTKPRGATEGELFISGRDVEEIRGALSFDMETGSWGWNGTVAEVKGSREREEIITVMRSVGTPMKPKDIHEKLDGKRSLKAVQQNLLRMKEKGLIENSVKGRGWYTVAPTGYPI